MKKVWIQTFTLCSLASSYLEFFQSRLKRLPHNLMHYLLYRLLYIKLSLSGAAVNETQTFRQRVDHEKTIKTISFEYIINKSHPAREVIKLSLLFRFIEDVGCLEFCLRSTFQARRSSQWCTSFVPFDLWHTTGYTPSGNQ